MKQYPDLTKTTIVITGASSGAGRAMALELASHGAILVLAARREEALKELVTECEQLGAIALAVPTNMQEVSDIQFLAHKAETFGGRIDVWINNAGVLAAGPIEDLPADVNEGVIRTNLLGYMHSAHTVVPYFKKQRSGILINNISVGGWFPTPYAAAYSASKFGIRGFSESLKGELQGWNDIHVCDLYPGFLDTPGMQHAANHTGRELKPAPPVYSPEKLATAVVDVIREPRKRKTVGLASGLMRLAWLLSPMISRKVTVFVMRRYLEQARRIPGTDGNVLKPVLYGTSTDGNWRRGGTGGAVKKGIVAAAAGGIILGLLLANKGGERESDS